jgi:N-acetylglutamate synthase-like GNAT family acetyltransferase
VTKAALTIVDATASDLSMMVTALAEAGLPTLDVGGPDQHFFCFRDEDGALAGFSGLELRGTDALLRSVLVLPTQRRRGLGRAIVQATLDRAGTLGARRIFLLTTNAEAFFANLGFATTPRSSAPAPIAATAEFKQLCPATAICMTRASGPAP